ncbi:hypothetical protein KJI95_08605 [Shewanella sp. JM162201]|uniref:Uncharacterized protein n=1 Tax=Shewanella jiangmenensis TaxID=2837387 RepID=A0ABS5V3T5_9GAMM|nr:hypothetical protein [Shewanella jiangmenensis]MBT1444590.1 hypothetical protein [Shewanella jiangmenensis]
MFRFCVAAPLLCALTAQAETQSLNLFGQSLAFELPAGWKQASFEERPGVISAEFVPELENLNEWNSLICVQSFKVADAGMLPENFLDSLASSYAGACQGNVTYEKLGDVEVNGHRGVHGILGCSRMPNQHQSMENQRPFFSEPTGEVGYFSVISRPGQLLLLHKSMRGDVFQEDKVPLTGANHKAFISAMMPIKLL